MTFYTVTIEDTGESFRCSSQESLLAGMERLGKCGIPVGCRGGGCGVCKVQITVGCYVKRVMSRAHISEQDEAAGRLLACRVRPTSDLRLTLLGAMKDCVCAKPSSAWPTATHAAERF